MATKAKPKKAANRKSGGRKTGNTKRARKTPAPKAAAGIDQRLLDQVVSEAQSGFFDLNTRPAMIRLASLTQGAVTLDGSETRTGSDIASDLRIKVRSLRVCLELLQDQEPLLTPADLSSWLEAYARLSYESDRCKARISSISSGGPYIDPGQTARLELMTAINAVGRQAAQTASLATLISAFLDVAKAYKAESTVPA